MKQCCLQSLEGRRDCIMQDWGTVVEPWNFGMNFVLGSVRCTNFLPSLPQDEIAQGVMTWHCVSCRGNICWPKRATSTSSMEARPGSLEEGIRPVRLRLV